MKIYIGQFYRSDYRTEELSSTPLTPNNNLKALWEMAKTMRISCFNHQVKLSVTPIQWYDNDSNMFGYHVNIEVSI